MEFVDGMTLRQRMREPVSIAEFWDLFVRSIFVNDYATILGTTIFFSVLFILAYLIQDILYAMIDPRIRVAGGEA